MKRLLIGIGLCASLIVSGYGCGVQKIDQGYEGAKINVLGSDKGEIEILGQGWQIYNSFKYDIVQNPTFVQEYVWTANNEEGSYGDESITFQSSNSLPFTADVGISFNMIPGKTGEIYKKYHKNVKEMIDSNLRNSVRDAFNREASLRSAENIYGKGKTIFIADVEKDVRDFWKDYLDIKKIYIIGKLEPPEQVRVAIAKKIEATQKAQQRRNEVEQSKAEADKKIEEARGQAESAKIAADAKAYKILTEAKAEAKSIELVNKQLSRSPEYVEYVKANKWDGKLPGFIGGQSPIPMINVK